MQRANNVRWFLGGLWTPNAKDGGGGFGDVLLLGRRRGDNWICGLLVVGAGRPAGWRCTAVVAVFVSRFVSLFSSMMCEGMIPVAVGSTVLKHVQRTNTALTACQQFTHSSHNL